MAECTGTVEKIIPPKTEYIDYFLRVIGYEEKEVTIDGETYTILVKTDESES